MELCVAFNAIFASRAVGNFTSMTPPRGKTPAMKALALLLYAMGNVSFGSIARILGVSDVAEIPELGPRRSAQASRAINQG